MTWNRSGHLARTSADEIIANAQDYGKLDVAQTLSYPVLIRLLDFIIFGVHIAL